jgi:hypothetical protein
MIRDLTVRNFRGFEHLEVKGLGRVNLIIGRNDTGKTSLMGAAAFVEGPAALAWAPLLGHPALTLDDFERVWRPMLRMGRVEQGVQLETTSDTEVQHSVEIGVTVPRIRGAFEVRYMWDRNLTVWSPNGGFAPPVSMGEPNWWSPSAPEPEENLVDPLTRIYTQGNLHRVVEAMRIIQPGLERLDIIGTTLYVVLAGSLPLPLSILGDGSRRLLEFAIPIADNAPAAYIDEIENGFHWSTLAKVWTLLRTSTVEQTFATTHREENIRIACENFIEAGDDGLRIVRLDRTDAGHRAVVYSAEEALAAMESGLEIRG